MDEKLKHRIVGGIVLLSVAVIVIPIMFGTDDNRTAELSESTIPPNPQAQLKTVTNPVITQWEDKRLANVVPEPIISEHDDELVTALAAPIKNTPTTTPNEITTASPTPKETVALIQKPKPVEPKSAATTPPPAKTTPKPQMVMAPATGKAWAVQVGSFSERANAERLRDKLIKSGYRAFVNKSRAKNQNVVRVRVGPELVRSNADKLSKKLQKELSLQTMVVEHR